MLPEPQDFHAADGNVQKKIIPWMSMLPRENLEDGLTDDLLAKQKREGKLVLVASLIEKVPNLGGECWYLTIKLNTVAKRIRPQTLSLTSQKL